ncbi:hypothetical protein [Paraburkholderia sp. DHOC27]|uniref:hypothetical protein n=1 Tax=Paraburkholderia sp. DHOC27 TaxID=2303330 RepID=UPI000E3D2F7C|nr:hypothetical protein [Paraburkholderia sp. DHOC27]RFU44997.1 hypothetical protein D0B32_24935 [Paraburkholderia sp. DHOC27]
MQDAFDIADPRDDDRGGYLNFTIHDGTATIPGRISASAMRILMDATNYSPVEVFQANKMRIRSAAYKSRRQNPTLAMVMLGTVDFS